MLFWVIKIMFLSLLISGVYRLDFRLMKSGYERVLLYKSSFPLLYVSIPYLSSIFLSFDEGEQLIKTTGAYGMLFYSFTIEKSFTYSC